jgi:hypothetical protein
MHKNPRLEALKRGEIKQEYATLQTILTPIQTSIPFRLLETQDAIGKQHQNSISRDILKEDDGCLGGQEIPL